jgi:hypothetical protein
MIYLILLGMAVLGFVLYFCCVVAGDADEQMGCK